VFNLGAPPLEALFARFHRICEDITFHPASHRQTDLESLLGDAPVSD